MAGKKKQHGNAARDLKALRRALAHVVKAEVIDPWLQKPNPSFDGLTPLEVIERGQIDRPWAMVYRLESGVPG
ncbi:MAG: DUF2384 domain-containing protein [Planctomycetota bacterium]|nr:DUF2384 domain-containing protein [Planctomycetota bacterium]